MITVATEYVVKLEGICGNNKFNVLICVAAIIFVTISGIVSDRSNGNRLAMVVHVSLLSGEVMDRKL